MKIFIPGFGLAGQPSVTIAQVKEKRYPVLSRHDQALRAQIQAQEDARIFDALDGNPWCKHNKRLRECDEDECVTRSVIES